jgi:hypothetical protein
VLYAIAPRLVRYSGAGLLESAKVFFLLWGVVLTLEQVERRRPITAVWVGVCAAGLCLARGEGVFLLPLFVAYLLLLPAWQCWRDAGEPGARLRRLMSEALVSVRLLGLSGMVCLLLCVPQLLYIRAVTGYAALDSRQAAVVQRTLVQLRLTEAGDAESAAAKYMESTRQGQPRRDARAEDTVTLGRNLREAVKGLDLFILGLALVGLGPRLYRRQAGVDDLVAAGVILYNTALFAGVGYITKRYTMPTMPFLLGWSAAGVSILRQRLFLRLPASAFRNTVAVVVGVSLWHGLSSVRARWGARQPDPACEFGRWLAPRRAALTKAQPVRLVSDAGGLDYHDGRQPIVAATYPQYAFWAAADYVGIPHDRLMDVDELRRLLAEKQVDLLVVDDDLRLTCPDFRPDVPWLDPVPDTPANAGFRVFRVRRGIRTSEDQ